MKNKATQIKKDLDGKAPSEDKGLTFKPEVKLKINAKRDDQEAGEAQRGQRGLKLKQNKQTSKIHA